jgi:iron complex outermembrane recepter protein
MRNHELIFKFFMKYILSIFIFSLCILYANGQDQKNSLHGKIMDINQNSLPGATVILVGTGYGVSANEDGEYLFNKLPASKLKVQVSFVGFKTQSVDFEIKPGQNVLDLTLEKENISLNGVTVTSQKRNQQILEVPITMSVIDAGFIKDNHITELDKLSEYVPGLQIRMHGTDRPSFVIRGINSDEVSPADPPRISVFYNDVPISRQNGAAMALFDMQQVDVLKGPQGTLFGRGSEIGAINYVSQKPSNNFNGFLAAGIGNFNQKEIDGAINIPIIKDKLLIRAAGIYDYQNGYIKNTFGGNLSGRNTKAGRFAATFLPTVRDKIDFVLNYQKDNNPGLGYMSMSYPNTEGNNNPYNYITSLEQGKNLANDRDIFDVTLTMKHFFNENSYLTSISSFRKISTYTRWDGDGTAAPAIDMSETDGARQFYQELRYNYSLTNNLTGSIGGSYFGEKANQTYLFSPNEQNMFNLFFNTGYLVTPDGQPYPVTNLPLDPQLGQLGGAPLITSHQEEDNNYATNQTLQGFADINYRLTGKLSIIGGARLINDWIKLTNNAQMTGGSPSTLGFLSGNYPNLFFKPSANQEIDTKTFVLTYRAGLKYALEENSTLFASYGIGNRPKVPQFTSKGEKQTLNAETVNSYDIGFKTVIQKRIWFDIGAFYYGYKNFQSYAWIANASTGQFNYIMIDGGKASAYGVEASVKYMILSGLQFFGDYAYIHDRFAANNNNSDKQQYANNTFSLSPDHSFAIGLNARVGIARDLFLFTIPSYSYKTRFFFDDANTMKQNGYGLLNLRCGIEYKNVSLALWGSNLLKEKYIISEGNTGSLFGDPTQIPGAPQMYGTKISWKF